MKQVSPSAPAPRLGLAPNAAQFVLLVVVNAFVGGMIGLERTLLPAIADEEFHLGAHAAMLSFIVVFGITKALTNYVAGRLSDRFGRRAVLVGGWLVAVPVPFLLMWAPTWSWILVANALLGVSQGLTWSTTVIMKMDLAGPERRGLATGLNEFAGYVAVAVAAWATGAIAEATHLRPEPFWLGAAFVFAGLALSVAFVRETRHHADLEAASRHEGPSADAPTGWQVFARGTWSDRNLTAINQAGLVNNLNDGVAWGLFPVVYAMSGTDLGRIGLLAAIYPGVWGVTQLATGPLSDRLGRKPLIVAGMWVQAVGIAWVIASSGFGGFATGNVLLGVGTAMVYPTLLAATGDIAHPTWRGSAVGVYRLWRDLGYAFGAVLAGVVADALGVAPAVWLVAALTFGSGVVVLVRMTGRAIPTAISVDQLRKLRRSGRVVVVDVRSLAEFTEAHVDGAVHVPADELPRHLADLSDADLVVTVCTKGGGRSQGAAETLRSLGLRHVRFLEGGTIAALGASHVQ